MDESVVVIQQPATDARYEDGGDDGDVETLDIKANRMWDLN